MARCSRVCFMGVIVVIAVVVLCVDMIVAHKTRIKHANISLISSIRAFDVVVTDAVDWNYRVIIILTVEIMAIWFHFVGGVLTVDHAVAYLETETQSRVSIIACEWLLD